MAQAIGEYSVPITDVTQFDDVFVQYLSLRLASVVCTPLVNDDAKAAALVKLAENMAGNAMRMNDEEGSTDHNDENSSVTSVTEKDLSGRLQQISVLQSSTQFQLK